MQKTILITGSTDGLGLATARALVSQGHRVLIHGRNAKKLEAARATLASDSNSAVEGYVADLSDLGAVAKLADVVAEQHDKLDVLVNNAGVLATPNPTTPDGLDVRFVVNTIAPYLLTQRLLPLLGANARVINLSSAAQSPVDLKALANGKTLPDFEAYGQSKLALTMWSRQLALSLGSSGPIVIAVNPGSFLGTKMVKEGFGREGRDIGIGADILCRLSTDGEFADASGQYFDNDAGRLASPHPDALDERKGRELVATIETLLGAEQ